MNSLKPMIAAKIIGFLGNILLAVAAAVLYYHTGDRLVLGFLVGMLVAGTLHFIPLFVRKKIVHLLDSSGNESLLQSRQSILKPVGVNDLRVNSWVTSIAMVLSQLAWLIGAACFLAFVWRAVR